MLKTFIAKCTQVLNFSTLAQSPRYIWAILSLRPNRNATQMPAPRLIISDKAAAAAAHLAPTLQLLDEDTRGLLPCPEVHPVFDASGSDVEIKE